MLWGPDPPLRSHAELLILGGPQALPPVPTPLTRLKCRNSGLRRKPQTKKTGFGTQIMTKVTDFTLILASLFSSSLPSLAMQLKYT